MALQVFLSRLPSKNVFSASETTRKGKVVGHKAVDAVPRLRQPSSYQYDMSLMKAFYFTEEGKQYLQFRMEGRNFFNIRGFGAYNTTIGTRYFGMITAAGQSPRSIQMSARIVF